MPIKPDTYHLKTASLQHTLNTASDFKNNFLELFNQLDITLIMHIRRYTDGSVFYLSNNPELVDFFFSNRCYNYAQGERHPSVFQKGFSLWDSWQPDKKDLNEYLNVAKPLKENFNTAHGIMIFDPKAEYCDLFSIASSQDNHQASLDYMANYSQITGAINQYQENAKALISKAHTLRHKNKYDINFNPFQDKGNNHIIQEPEIFNGTQIDLEKITRRETECLYWLHQGLTAKQIARQSHLSYRSVEVYLARIKQKLNCKNLCQLGYLIGAYKHHFDAVFQGFGE